MNIRLPLTRRSDTGFILLLDMAVLSRIEGQPTVHHGGYRLATSGSRGVGDFNLLEGVRHGSPGSCRLR